MSRSKLTWLHLFLLATCHCNCIFVLSSVLWASPIAFCSHFLNLHTVRTGLEGPGLTVAQKIWYCIATVGGQYIWARLQSFSAFRRWGDSEQVFALSALFIFLGGSWLESPLCVCVWGVGLGAVGGLNNLLMHGYMFSEVSGSASMDYDTENWRII